MMVQRYSFPLIAAGGLVTFVATKVTKKAFSRKASLPHKAFALQISQNHGLHLSAPLHSLRPMLQRKFAMPLSRSRPPSFCLISSEAVLLSGKKIFYLLKPSP
jgi:hypothetical protein